MRAPISRSVPSWLSWVQAESSPSNWTIAPASSHRLSSYRSSVSRLACRLNRRTFRTSPPARSSAHVILQVRTRVLNEDLREMFQRWYPGMKANV